MEYAGRDDVLVLGLPRGGVPVARRVADALGVPLEVLLVRKLGVPEQPELAMGAIACVGERWAIELNKDIIRILGLPDEVIQETAERERREIERRQQLYRDGAVEVGASADVQRKVLIVVDDGLATGATMRAAVSALRMLEPGRIVVAVPVAPKETVEELAAEVDEVVCLLMPAYFGGVSQWYKDFSQVSNETVREMLRSRVAVKKPYGAR